MLVRWLLWLSAAYLLTTLAMAGLLFLFPEQGARWWLVAILLLPISIVGDAAGAVVEMFLLTPGFVERWGRKKSQALLILIYCGLFLLSWFTLQQFKS